MNIFKGKKGFTLVEMLIAVAIFTLISTFSIGAVLSIFDANKKSQHTKTVVDNLNFAIENMVRTVRFGDRYHCDSGSGSLTTAQDCSGGTRLAVRFEGNTIVYRLYGTTLQRSNNGGSDYTNITASDAVIQHLRFYVFGASTTGDSNQPYAIAVIKGYVGSKPTTQTVFSIETMMSQKNIDI